jgi:hypothetical protein
MADSGHRRRLGAGAGVRLAVVRGVAAHGAAGLQRQRAEVEAPLARVPKGCLNLNLGQKTYENHG